MSSVKIENKEKLERLAAKILLKTGKKITQQELLAKCVQFTDERLEEFLIDFIKENRIWEDKEIKNLEEQFIFDFGEGTENLSEQVDDIIYGEH